MKSIGVSILLATCFYISTVRGADEDRSRLSWNSPRVQELDRELNELFASFTEPSTKLNYENRANQVDRLISSRLTLVDMQDLVADNQVPAESDQLIGLQRLVITRMIWVFLKQGDRKSLVSLFSKCCLDTYHFMAIEELLVIHGEKLKYPIKVLAEARAECKREPTRKGLAATLRRSFEGSGIHDENDDAFVTKAMEWYDREKDKLDWNPNYDWHSSGGKPTKPLFRPNDTPEAIEFRRSLRPDPMKPQ